MTFVNVVEAPGSFHRRAGLVKTVGRPHIPSLPLFRVLWFVLSCDYSPLAYMRLRSEGEREWVRREFKSRGEP